MTRTCKRPYLGCAVYSLRRPLRQSASLPGTTRPQQACRRLCSRRLGRDATDRSLVPRASEPRSCIRYHRAHRFKLPASVAPRIELSHRGRRQQDTAAAEQTDVLDGFQDSRYSPGRMAARSDGDDPVKLARIVPQARHPLDPTAPASAADAT